MAATWRREDIPYDAMGDYSAFQFEEDEEAECRDRDGSDDMKEKKE